MNSLVNESIHKFSNIIFYLVLVLESMFPNVKNQEKQQLEEYLSNNIINYFLERTTTVLHVVSHKIIKKENWEVTTADLDFMQLFLKFGARVSAIDFHGPTPLHYPVKNKRAYLDFNLAIIQALVDAGAHLHPGCR